MSNSFSPAELDALGTGKELDLPSFITIDI